MSVRTDKVAEAFREEIMNIIQRELKDPNVGIATVTHVRVARDIKHADVFFSILGDHQEQERGLKALDRAKGFIRTALGKRVRMKFTPELVFHLDTTIEDQMRVAEILKKLEHQEDEPA